MIYNEKIYNNCDDSNNTYIYLYLYITINYSQTSGDGHEVFKQHRSKSLDVEGFVAERFKGHRGDGRRHLQWHPKWTSSQHICSDTNSHKFERQVVAAVRPHLPPLNQAQVAPQAPEQKDMLIRGSRFPKLHV